MTVAHNVPEYSPKGESKYFGIDYDDTYTVCPDVFQEFIAALKDRGHKAYFVTFRTAELFGPVIQEANKLGIPAIATEGVGKREATEALGVFIDVWVDDMPDLIVS